MKITTYPIPNTQYTIHQGGQTLIEVLLAVAVAIIVVVSLLGIGIAAMRTADFGKNQSEAVRLTSQTLEYLRSLRDSGYTSFTNDLTNNNCGTTGCCVTVSGTTLSIVTFSTAACTKNQIFESKFISVVGANGVTINAVTSFKEGVFKRDVTLTQVFTNWQ